MKSHAIVDKLLEQEEETEDPKTLLRQAMDRNLVIFVNTDHGSFVFDRTGTILINKHLYPSPNLGPEWGGAEQPVRLDVEEWQKAYPGQAPNAGEHHIFDWGHWTQAGDYVRPDEQWRQHLRGMSPARLARERYAMARGIRAAHYDQGAA